MLVLSNSYGANKIVFTILVLLLYEYIKLLNSYIANKVSIIVLVLINVTRWQQDIWKYSTSKFTENPIHGT